jgi:hypothetical protein
MIFPARLKFFEKKKWKITARKTRRNARNTRRTRRRRGGGVPEYIPNYNYRPDLVVDHLEGKLYDKYKNGNVDSKLEKLRKVGVPENAIRHAKQIGEQEVKLIQKMTDDDYISDQEKALKRHKKMKEHGVSNNYLKGAMKRNGMGNEYITNFFSSENPHYNTW